jgi:hypothetical protein
MKRDQGISASPPPQKKIACTHQSPGGTNGSQVTSLLILMCFNPNYSFHKGITNVLAYRLYFYI